MHWAKLSFKRTSCQNCDLTSDTFCLLQLIWALIGSTMSWLATTPLPKKEDKNGEAHTGFHSTHAILKP